MLTPKNRLRPAGNLLQSITLLVAPSCVFVVWAGSYFLKIIKLPETLKVPLRFSYQNKHGKFTVEALITSIEPSSLSAKAANAKFFGPDSKQILKAKDIIFQWKGDAGGDIQIGFAEASISRTKTGFSISEAFQSEGPSGKPIPFSVQAKRIICHFDDPLALPVFKKDLDLRNLRFDGQGDTWLAKGTWFEQQATRIPVVVKNSPGDGLSIDLKLKNFDATSYVNYGKSWIGHERLKNIEPLSIQKAVLTGPVCIILEPNKEPYVETDFRAIVEGTRVADFVQNVNLEIKAKSAGYYTQAEAILKSPGQQAEFSGIISFEKGPIVAGKLVAITQNDRFAAPFIKKALPAGVHFNNAKLDGWFTWDPSGPQFKGQLKAATLNKDSTHLNDIDILLEFNETSALANVIKGRAYGINPSGSIFVDFPNRIILGYLEGKNIETKHLRSSFSQLPFSGPLSFLALIDGNLSNPEISIDVNGKAKYAQPGGVSFDLGHYSARAKYRNQKLELERAKLLGFSGEIAGFGQYDFQNQQLRGELSMGGLNLSFINPEIAGWGFIKTKVDGILTNPTIKGWADLYNLSFNDTQLPLITTDLICRKSQLEFENFHATLNTGDLSGKLKFWPLERQYYALLQANNLQASEWSQGAAKGLFSLKDVIVGGKNDQAIGSASFSANTLILNDDFQNALIQNVQSPIIFDPKSARIGPFQASIGSGTVSGTAQFDISKSTMSGDIKARNIPLSQIPIPGSKAELGGLLNTHIQLEANKAGLKSFSSGTGLTDVLINHHPIGTGSCSVSYNGKAWEGFGIIGTIDRTLQLNSFLYDTNNKKLGADVYVDNIAVQDLVRLGYKALPKMPEKIHEALVNLKADVKGDILLSGTIDNLNIDAKNFSGENIWLQGRRVGEIQAELSRQNKVWDITKLNWLSDDGALMLNGKLDEEKDLLLQADLKKLNLNALSVFYPNLANATGFADGQFQASGKSAEPTIEGALTCSDIGYVDQSSGVHPLPIAANIENFTYNGSSKELKFSGKVNYDDIYGQLKGYIPTTDLNRMNVALHIEPQELELIAKNIEWLDLKKSKGTLDGNAQLVNHDGRYGIEGLLKLSNSTLVFNNFHTPLTNTELSIKWNDQSFNVNGTAQDSGSGRIQAQLQASYPSFLNDGLKLNDILSSSQLKGNIDVNDVSVDAAILSDKNSLKTHADTHLNVSGSLLDPKLSGDITVDRLAVNFIPDFLGAKSNPTPKQLINPSFENIEIRSLSPSNIKTKITFSGIKAVDADVTTRTHGYLSGSLAAPDLSLTNTVESGHLRLPTARIQFREGGTASLIYKGDPSRPSILNLNLDLEGSTQMTMRNGSGAFDRYTVTYHMTGDPLSDSFKLTASSEPGDYKSQELIDQLISGGSLGRLVGIGAIRGNDLYDPSVKSALLGLALPMLVSNFTENIGFLDYIAMDYDPLYQSVFTAGKTFRNGLTIRAIKSLDVFGAEEGTTERDRKQIAELGVTYRLPIKSPFMGRTSIGIAYDHAQKHPIKFNLEYSKRL